MDELINNAALTEGMFKSPVVYKYYDYTVVWIIIVFVIIAGVVFFMVQTNALKKEIVALQNT